jgi:hypothetical protein
MVVFSGFPFFLLGESAVADTGMTDKKITDIRCHSCGGRSMTRRESRYVPLKQLIRSLRIYSIFTNGDIIR